MTKVGLITQRLLGADPDLRVQEYTRGYLQFVHKTFGVVGVDPEEGEFLYGLVRLLKPSCVLETGTNVGISTRYIAMAICDNGVGAMFTVEWDNSVWKEATEKMRALGVDGAVDRYYLCPVAEFQPKDLFSFVFLDTELATRYGEFVRFYGNLAEHAVVCIHDLPRLNVSEFGELPPLIKEGIGCGYIGRISFPSVHGLTVFQKHEDPLI